MACSLISSTDPSPMFQVVVSLRVDTSLKALTLQSFPSKELLIWIHGIVNNNHKTDPCGCSHCTPWTLPGMASDTLGGVSPGHGCLPATNSCSPLLSLCFLCSWDSCSSKQGIQSSPEGSCLGSLFQVLLDLFQFFMFVYIVRWLEILLLTHELVFPTLSSSSLPAAYIKRGESYAGTCY